MDESKPLEEIRNWLDAGTPNSRRKSSWFSWRIRRVSSTTSRLISRCRWSHERFLVHVTELQITPSRWTKTQTLLSEKRIIPYSTDIHRCIQNYSYEFGCQAREAHRWLLEYRWVSRLVWSLDRGFTQFTLLEEKAPDGYMWSGWRLTRKQLTSRPDHLWPELWKSMGKHAKLKEKQKWSEEKLHHENARKLRGIYFIDPEDTEFKETIKNARKKLETSVAPAMPCKIMKNVGVVHPTKLNKTCVYSGSWWIHKTAYGKLDTATLWRPYCRKRWEFITTLQFGS